MSKPFKFSKSTLLLLMMTSLASISLAQSPNQKKGPTVYVPEAQRPMGLGRTNLQCSGYFRMSVLPQMPQIVGGQEEQEKTIYAAGDFVYIDAGQQQGVKEGQEFHIIRPKGELISYFSEKKGYLGVYVQEIGEVKVVKVEGAVSIGQITYSCDSATLGDFLTGVPDRGTPEPERNVSFDRFSEPGGRPLGRVLMAKDGREMVSTGDLIYVDIGDEDKITTGDYLTIFRPIGTGNLNVKTYDIAHRGSEGFASTQFRGGGLSNQAARARELKGDEGIYRHGSVTSSQIKSKRPAMPPKVLGEAMIINVQSRTATAIVTNVAQEIHTGDFVVPR